ncbi:hypothetical protein Acr_00g0078040 [Actinidia rufa]|uniref:Uncharacterized protein n=1 Tax=Actinidia rufa TaxID=165716 RepID=A0A7J0DTR6_9ERIC|nr:hypothetical protein Acr_00g0078040 [Actinidia rufa]
MSSFGFWEAVNYKLGMMASSLSKDFNELFRNRSEKCKEAIQALNNRRVPRKVTDLLKYKPIYRHIIPHRAEQLAKLDEGATLARDLDLNKGNTSSLSSFMSSDSLDSEDEEGKEPVDEDVIAYSYFEDRSLDISSGKDSQPTPSPVLALTSPSKVELSLSEEPLLDKHKGRQLIGVMIPKDIADLAEEGLKEISDLLVMQQSKKKVNNLESVLKQSKLALAATEQLKLELAVVKEARDASYATATQTQNKSVTVGAQRDKALQDLTELQAVAELCPEIYLEGWLAYLTDLGIPVDNPTWTKTTPEVELLDFPKPLSPLILPSFNEDEYMNQPTE